MADTATLSGMTALVTGGGRGIGRAIALAFAERGCAVAVGARTGSEIETVAGEIRALGSPALSVVLDVTETQSCTTAVTEVLQTWDHIDILVNNAGIAGSGKFTEIDDEIWQRSLDVNLTGPFRMTGAVLPSMLGRGTGAVITIASVAAKIGGAYIAPYTAAKHGVLGLTRALAVEYAASGVTFNCVCPGYVETAMTEASIRHIMAKTGRTWEQALAPLLTPQRRLVTTGEVAAVCVLLASPEGRGISGQAINVDGGMVQW
ncbi:MAG: SDR family NAD(P)-dependent oxidoreductase [Chloroflexota bacterium]